MLWVKRLAGRRLCLCYRSGGLPLPPPGRPGPQGLPPLLAGRKRFSRGGEPGRSRVGLRLGVPAPAVVVGGRVGG